MERQLQLSKTQTVIERKISTTQMKLNIVIVDDIPLLNKTVVGLTLYPFIFLKKSYLDVIPEQTCLDLINHELIHIKQQEELLVIPFYVWYLLEWFIKSFKYGEKAYRNISFEREAYMFDSDVNYLLNRKFWSFIKFI